MTKYPHRYAAEIIKLPNHNRRDAAIKKAPKHLQSLIKKHIEIYFDKIGEKENADHYRAEQALTLKA